MKKQFMGKRLLSIALVFTVLSSMASVLIGSITVSATISSGTILTPQSSSYATNADIAWTEKTDDGQTIEESVLNGLKPTIKYAQGEGEKSPASADGWKYSNTTYWTDTKTKSYDVSIVFFKDVTESGYANGYDPDTMTYDVNGVDTYFTATYTSSTSFTDVDQFWMLSNGETKDSTNNYAIGIYELYISDDESTLYNNTNKILTFVNNEKTNIQKLKFDKKYSGKYFGIKVIMGACIGSGQWQEITRIAEVGLFSELPEYIVLENQAASYDTGSSAEITEKSASGLTIEQNALYNANANSVSLWGKKDASSTYANSYAWNTFTEKAIPLNDGDIKNNDLSKTLGVYSTYSETTGRTYVNGYTGDLSSYTIPSELDAYGTIRYVGSFENAEEFWMISSSTDGGSGKFAIGAYELYITDVAATGNAANDNAELFKAENKFATYINVSGTNFQKLKFTKPVSGVQFGVKIILGGISFKGTHNNTYPRIAEIALFTQIKDYEVVTSTITTGSNVAITDKSLSGKDITQNLLYGIDGKDTVFGVKKNGEDYAVKDAYGNRSPFNLNDGIAKSEDLSALSTDYAYKDGDVTAYRNGYTGDTSTYVVPETLDTYSTIKYSGNFKNVDEFWMISHHGTGENHLAAAVYELYMTDVEATGDKATDNNVLFQADNKILTYINKDGKNFQKIYLAEPISGKQFGIKIIMSAMSFKPSTADGNGGARIAEVALFNGPVVECTESEVGSAYVTDYKSENILNGITPTVADGEIKASANLLTDGDASKDKIDSGSSVAIETDKSTDITPITLAYDLGEIKAVKRVLIYYSALNTTSGTHKPGVDNIELFLKHEGSTADLFIKSNSVTKLTLVAETAKGILVEFDEVQNVSEIGFKLYTDDTHTAAYLLELGAYAVSSKDPVVTKVDGSYVEKNKSLNLLAPATTNKNYNGYWVAYTKQHSWDQLYDGKAEVDIYKTNDEAGDSVGIAISEQTDAKFKMTLSESSTVDRILAYYGSEMTPTAVEIYTSNESTSDNLFDINNKLGTFSINNGTAEGMLVTLPTAITVKHIGFRFTPTPATSRDYIVLMELAAYSPVSEKIYYRYYEDNIDADNRISKVTLDTSNGAALQYATGGTYNRNLDQLIDGIIPSTSVAKAYNNSTNGGGLFITKGDDGKIRLIAELRVTSYIDNLIMFYVSESVKNTKVYVSENKDDLFSTEPVFEGAPGQWYPGVSYKFYNEAKGNYVGIELSDFVTIEGKEGVILTELGAFGRTSPNYNPTLTEPVPNATGWEEQKAWVTDNHSNNLIKNSPITILEPSGDESSDSKSPLLKDGLTYEEGGQYINWRDSEEFIGSQELCYTIPLGQNVPIDKILIVNQYGGSPNYYPLLTQEYEIYVGTDAETLYTDANLVAYCNNTGKNVKNADDTKPNSYQMFDFGNDKPTGSIVGIRIIKCCEYDVSVRLQEIGVYSGSAVAPDPIYSQAFTDSKTGVEVKIRKLDFNDNYQEVGSIKLERVANTQEVLDKAAEYYLENVGDRYKITLYDKSGKIITAEDLGGRRVDIYMPYKYTVGENIYVCTFNNGEFARLNTVTFSDKILVPFTDDLQIFGFYKDTFANGMNNPKTIDWDPVRELSELEYGTIEEYLDATVDYASDTDEIDEQATQNRTKKIAKTITNTVTAPLTDYWWLFAILIAVILIAGGISALIIIKNRKRRN